jgi:hypothetical protein
MPGTLSRGIISVDRPRFEHRPTVQTACNWKASEPAQCDRDDPPYKDDSQFLYRSRPGETQLRRSRAAFAPEISAQELCPAIRTHDPGHGCWGRTTSSPQDIADILMDVNRTFFCNGQALMEWCAKSMSMKPSSLFSPLPTIGCIDLLESVCRGIVERG